MSGVTSVRFNGTDTSIATATLVRPCVNTNTSRAFFAKIAVDRNTFSSFLTVISPQQEIDTDADGTTINLFDATGTITGPNLVVGRWFFLAYTSVGVAGSATGKMYFKYVGEPTCKIFTTASTLSAPIITTVRWAFADVGESLNGNICGGRLWDRVLSRSEIEAESTSIAAVNRANLIGDWHLSGDKDLFDYSGNRNHLTSGGGTLAREAGPPNISGRGNIRRSSLLSR